MSSWCRIGPALLSSWFPHGSLVSSAVADQLLILFPTWWARPPLAPFAMVTPFPSGSTHSPTPQSATIRFLFEMSKMDLIESFRLCIYIFITKMYVVTSGSFINLITLLQILFKTAGIRVKVNLCSRFCQHVILGPKSKLSKNEDCAFLSLFYALGSKKLRLKIIIFGI